MDRLTVGLHPAVMPWAPEIRYVVRTMLTIAGFSWRFALSRGAGDPNETPDLYYGPDPALSDAGVRIRSAGIPFTEMEGREPLDRADRDGLCFLDFVGGPDGFVERDHSQITFHNDILLSAFWLLSGAPEPTYPTDRRDNLDLSGTFFLRERLLETPVVSQYAVRLRRLFVERGREPSPPTLGTDGVGPALVLTHDVDYPEIVRAVEAVRVAARPGPARLRRALDVLAGRIDYWRFADWVEFAEHLGGRPTFFFMASRGSLVNYAAGTPDAFYDVGAERFRRLFRELIDEGCEVGLHPSYDAYGSEATLRRERSRLESEAGVEVRGARHHYWHLDPSAPADTLLLQARSGLRYDSTLAFEFYPGFRRGVCHPFRPFHPGERRELDLVEVPPSWMDDHFGRRVDRNRVEDPMETAGRLLRAVAETGGAAVLDYHVRGMEGRVFPAYGPWLRSLVEDGALDGFETVRCMDMVDAFEEHAARLEGDAVDTTDGGGSRAIGVRTRGDSARFVVTDAREGDFPEVARLHHWFYRQGVFRGDSLARLGPDSLERLFYGLNRDNPLFFCDVARWRGRVIGWSAYATDRDDVFRIPLRRDPLRVVREVLGAVIRDPRVVGSILGNARYLGGDPVDLDETVEGWWIVAGVRPEYRTEAFESRIGGSVASALFDRMETRFREAGCEAWYGVVRPDNTAIVRFLEERGAVRVGSGRAQGMDAAYYVTRVGAQSGAEASS